jgi:hypothetical protein
MGRQSIVKEDSNYDAICEMEAPEGGWGWIAAFGVAVMFVSMERDTLFL